MLFIGLTIFYFITLSAQKYEWARSIGGISDEYCQDMATDIEGNIFINGNLQGINVGFDPSPGTALLSSAGTTDVFFAGYSMPMSGFNDNKSNPGIGLIFYESYPNPARDKATLDLYLPENDRIQISLILTGVREQHLICNKEMTAGYHQVDLDLSAFSAGSWLIMIRTRSSTAVQKLIITGKK